MMTRLSVALAFAMWAAVVGAHAQSYPSRPVTVIVPFAAGGVTDIVARIVSERMKTALGQSVIIENVSGAGGTIGVTRLFRAAPDGYTLVVGQWTSHVGAGAMYPVPFDYLNDFEPVSMLSLAPLWIVGRSNLPAKDLRELIAWLKANPDKASAATTGLGSGIHMCLVYFQNMTGTKFPLAPYRGAAPLMQDMLAGQIDLSCPEAGQTLPQYRAGNIKAYAVLTEKRWFAAPDVPTIDEAGVPGLHFPFWHAHLGPQGYAEGRDRQAQCRGGGDLGGSGRAAAVQRARARDRAARAAVAGGARRLPQGRDRQVVADHQGCKHQAGMTVPKNHCRASDDARQ